MDEARLATLVATKLAAVRELMVYLTVAGGLVAPDWLRTNKSLLIEVDAMKTLKHEFESKKLSLAAICMGFDEANSSMHYGGAGFQITDFTLAQAFQQLKALDNSISESITTGASMQKYLSKKYKDVDQQATIALTAAQKKVDDLPVGTSDPNAHNNLSNANAAKPLTGVKTLQREILMILMAPVGAGTTDMNDPGTVKLYKDATLKINAIYHTQLKAKVAAAKIPDDEAPDTEDAAAAAAAATAWKAKDPKDILGDYDDTQEGVRRELLVGKYFRKPGDKRVYEVEVDGDKTRLEVSLRTLMASGFSTMDQEMAANPTFYFEILNGERRVELRFGTTNTDSDPTGTLQEMFGKEVYTAEKNEASDKLGETIENFLSTAKNLPRDVEDAMGAIILLIGKGDMFDELAAKGLIVNSKYVGGFFEKGPGNLDVEIRRVNEAFKLLHVVMKCTVGMVTSNGNTVGTELDEVEAGVNAALTVSKFRLKQLAVDEVDILGEVGKKITAIKDLSKRDDNLSQTMSVLLTAGDLLSKQSAEVLFMISSGISSFLFTATGDAEAPFTSIAKIAFQFLKARDFVKSVIAKTMGEGTTDISTDVNTDTLHYFGAGDANQIIARMLMAYS